MKYELLTILTLQAEQDLTVTVGKIEQMIKEAGGNPAAGHLMGRGKLVYPVKHERQGMHYAFPFESPANTLPALEKNLKLIPGLLRFMFTRDAEISRARAEAKAASASRGWATKGETPAPAEAVPSAAPAAVTAPVAAETSVPAGEEKKTLEDLDKRLSDILKEGV